MSQADDATSGTHATATAATNAAAPAARVTVATAMPDTAPDAPAASPLPSYDHNFVLHGLGPDARDKASRAQALGTATRSLLQQQALVALLLRLHLPANNGTLPLQRADRSTPPCPPLVCAGPPRHGLPGAPPSSHAHAPAQRPWPACADDGAGGAVLQRCVGSVGLCQAAMAWLLKSTDSTILLDRVASDATLQATFCQKMEACMARAGWCMPSMVVCALRRRCECGGGSNSLWGRARANLLLQRAPILMPAPPPHPTPPHHHHHTHTHTHTPLCPFGAGLP